MTPKEVDSRQIGEQIYFRFKDEERKRGTIVCLVGVHGDNKGNVTTKKNADVRAWITLIPKFETEQEKTKTLGEFLKREKDLYLEMLDISTDFNEAYNQ